MVKYLSLILLLILGTAARADVYKWTDENGRVHYGDRPSVEHEADEIQVDAAPGEKKPDTPQPVAP
ncbi:MAG: DUF4124 domain-containing protein, partial [Gammaproteobacteria bacterium]|nr:DUF4124 domain-containing protein [Gammaproteobacteria bacterium]